MITTKHDLRQRWFLLLAFALLLAGIAFSAMSAGAAGDNESDADDDETDIMAFDLP